MKRYPTRVAVATLFLACAVQAFAQPGYPTYKKPAPKPSASKSAAPSPAATATASPDATPAAATKPTGPLKMISTDGTNKSSPIRVTELNYYDEGYGSKYNAEVRISGAIQNTSKTAELKKVTVKLQVVDLDNQVIQEWKQSPGVLKPGQTYRMNPSVWRNSLGTVLKGRIMVDHEEAVEKDAKKDGTK